MILDREQNERLKNDEQVGSDQIGSDRINDQTTKRASMAAHASRGGRGGHRIVGSERMHRFRALSRKVALFCSRLNLFATRFSD